MARRESAQESAQAISTRWTPARYPVEWVETPDAVPPWDPARVGGSYVYRVQHEKESFDENLERSKLHGESIPEIREPPDEYPRLIRSTPWGDKQYLELQNQAVDHDLLNSLARLIPPKLRNTSEEQIMVSETFKNGVLDIALRFGSLKCDNPGSARDWLFQATLTAAYLDLLGWVEGSQGVGFDLSDALEELDKGWGINGDETPEGQMAQWVQLNIVFGFSILALNQEQRSDARKFRGAIAESFRRTFLISLRSQPTLEFELPGDVLQLRVGIDAWKNWLLSRLFAGGDPVRFCPGCGVAFAPRGKQKYCVPNISRCKMAAQRKIATTVPQLKPHKGKSKPVKS